MEYSTVMNKSNLLLQLYIMIQMNLLNIILSERIQIQRGVYSLLLFI